MEDLSNKSKKRNINYKMAGNGWSKTIIPPRTAISYAVTAYKMPSNRGIFRKFVREAQKGKISRFRD